MAAHAREALLVPGGIFAPSQIWVYAMLVGVRVTSVSGFDLRAFNVFRTSSAQGNEYDLDDAALVSPPGLEPWSLRCLCSAAVPFRVAERPAFESLP